MVKLLDSDHLGELGELHFARLCVEAQLVANKVNRDRTGWDYLVEFPFAETSLPFDSRPSPPEAKVQIKTVGTKATRFKIRLSAAERLAKHPQAAFICVLVVDQCGRLQSLYVLHVIGDLLSRILKELRKCEAKNSLQINQIFLSLPFAPYAPRSEALAGELRRQIESACGDNPDVYAELKKKELAELGFEVFRYSGSFSLVAESEAELTDIMLGLKAGAITGFRADQVRWNIPLPLFPEPVDGLMSVHSVARKGELIIKSTTGKLRLKVDAFFPAVGVTTPKIRLTCDIIDMLVDMKEDKLNLTSRGDEEGLSIDQLIELNTLQQLIMQGGRFDIRVERKSILRGEFNPETFNFSRDQIVYASRVFQLLSKVLSYAGAKNARIKNEDINVQLPRINFFNYMLFPTADIPAMNVNAVLAGDSVPRIDKHEILMLTYLYFGDACIGLAAVGTASVTGTGLLRTIRLSNLHAREVEAMDYNDEAIDAFRKDMQAQTGLALVLDVSRPRTASAAAP